MATMMLTPLSLAGVNTFASQAFPPPLTPSLTPSPAAAFEGVPIFLVPNSNQSLSSLALMPKVLQDLKANLANSAPKVDTSKHFHIFVGDLSSEIDNKSLKEVFSQFGEISDAKVIRDTQTLKSKGYGFVSFVNKEDAEKAIEGMNGRWLGRRIVRTNWATRKPAVPQPKNLTVEEVYNQTGPTNSTVYIGGTSANTTEQQLKDIFGKYGTILETRVFKQQGYCFVRYDTKESATHAICAMNGQDVNGSTIKCSWGKEDGGKPVRSNSLTNLTQMQLGNSASAAGYPFYYIYNNPAATTVLQQWQNSTPNYSPSQLQPPSTPVLSLGTMNGLSAFPFSLQ